MSSGPLAKQLKRPELSSRSMNSTSDTLTGSRAVRVGFLRANESSFAAIPKFGENDPIVTSRDTSSCSVD